MSVSLVSSSASSQTFQRPQGAGKEIRQGIDSLKKAVEAGDMSAVQSAYDSLSKLQADKQGSSASGSSSSSTTTASDGKDPLSKLLSSVGDALKSGDVSAVQQAFAQNGPPSGGPGGAGGRGGAGGPPPGGPPGGEGGSSEVRDAVGSLAQSLQSGDTTSAQDSLTALTKLLTAQDSDSDSDQSSSSGSSGSSSTKSSSNSFIELAEKQPERHRQRPEVGRRVERPEAVLQPDPARVAGREHRRLSV